MLGYVILLMLEKGGLPTESRIPLGSSKLVRSALLTGAIDIYPEYTGNAAFFFNQDSDPVWRSADAAYLRAKTISTRRTSSSGFSRRPPTTPGRSRCGRMSPRHRIWQRSTISVGGSPAAEK